MEKNWQYGTYAQRLHEAIRGLDRCLALSRVSAHLALAFQPTDRVFADSLVVFPFRAFALFAVLQSRVHEVWARFFGSSMKDDLRYSPSDCLETFPLPPNWQSQLPLEAIGRDYYEFRAALMVSNDEGLTKTYNRFHNPDDRNPDVTKLRELHAAMDRLVLDAYTWTAFQPKLDFILDYEDEGDEDNFSGRDRKEPWRYRWVDEDRDEVLARLLELNRTRAEEEAQSAAAVPPVKIASKRGTKPASSTPFASPNLFDVQEPTE